jgi:hypothetical protein
LRSTVTAILERIDRLTQEQIDSLKNADDERLLALDKELETTFGEKERAFGALFHHREEHGC